MAGGPPAKEALPQHVAWLGKASLFSPPLPRDPWMAGGCPLQQALRDTSLSSWPKTLLLNKETPVAWTGEPLALRSEARKSALTTLIHHRTGSSSPCNKVGKRKDIGKQEIKLCLFVDDTGFYVENPKEYCFKKSLLEPIGKLTKITVYKTNAQKSVMFLYSNNEYVNIETENTIPFMLTPKK